MVWLVTCLADLVLGRMIDGKHVNLDLDHATALLAVRLGVLVAHLQPEARRIVLVELELLIPSILGQHAVIVALVEGQRLLDETAVLDELLQVDLGLADHVIALEEVTIVHLHGELVVLARHLNLVDETVLEVGLAVLVTVMRVRLLCVFL